MTRRPPVNVSQAALLASLAAPAALGPRGLAEARAAAAAAAAGAGPEGPGRALRPVLGHVDVELASLELVLVELLDALLGFFLVRELDEGETSRPAGVAVGRQIDVNDLPGFCEQVGELALGRVVTQVSDKYLGWNGLVSFWLELMEGRRADLGPLFRAPAPRSAAAGPGEATALGRV